MQLPKANYFIEIKKSKFISFAYFINDENEVKNILDKLKQEHKKAKHITYGFKISNNNEIKIKGFDASEPKGVASMPIIKAIEINNLNNIAIFIIRYFGNIKLGLKKLNQTYAKCAYEIAKLIKQI